MQSDILPFSVWQTVRAQELVGSNGHSAKKTDTAGPRLWWQRDETTSQDALIVKLVSLSFDTDIITNKCRGWASTSVSAEGQEDL